MVRTSNSPSTCDKMHHHMHGLDRSSRVCLKKIGLPSKEKDPGQFTVVGGWNAKKILRISPGPSWSETRWQEEDQVILGGTVFHKFETFLWNVTGYKPNQLTVLDVHASRIPFDIKLLTALRFLGREECFEQYKKWMVSWVKYKKWMVLTVTILGPFWLAPL